MKPCPVCGGEVAPKTHGGPPRTFCSVACRTRHHRMRRGSRRQREVICPECEQMFLLGPSTGKRGDAVYCSEGCRANAWHKRWQRVNRERVNNGRRRTYARRPEVYHRRQAKWRAENPEKVRAMQRSWRHRNAEHVRAYARGLRWGPELSPLAEAIYLLKKEVTNHADR